MKRFLLVIFVFVCVMGMKAQDATVATLDSKDGSRSFYGPNAFIEAVDAAQSGDRITLSGGTFKSPTIKKCLKIQGAGFIDDQKKGLYKTVIVDPLSIDLPEDDADGFLLEGIYSTDYVHVKGKAVNNLTIRRCRVNDIWLYASNNTNTKIEHCRLANGINQGSSSKNLLISNSVVRKMSSNELTTSMTFLNCVVGSVEHNTVARFENCILHCYSTGHHEGNAAINPNCMIVNTVAFSDQMFNNIKEWNGSSYSTPEKVFKVVGVEIYTDEATYELTDEAKNLYVDNSGSPIGIYGGLNPYQPIPANPRVVSKKIDTRSSNGKLNVEIKVEAQNY